MGFPDNVVVEALTLCGRCCICYKFCGTKIELHHFEQKACYYKKPLTMYAWHCTRHINNERLGQYWCSNPWNMNDHDEICVMKRLCGAINTSI